MSRQTDRIFRPSACSAVQPHTLRLLRAKKPRQTVKQPDNQSIINQLINARSTCQAGRLTISPLQSYPSISTLFRASPPAAHLASYIVHTLCIVCHIPESWGSCGCAGTLHIALVRISSSAAMRCKVPAYMYDVHTVTATSARCSSCSSVCG